MHVYTSTHTHDSEHNLRKRLPALQYHVVHKVKVDAEGLDGTAGTGATEIRLSICLLTRLAGWRLVAGTLPGSACPGLRNRLGLDHNEQQVVTFYYLTNNPSAKISNSKCSGPSLANSLISGRGQNVFIHLRSRTRSGT